MILLPTVWHRQPSQVAKLDGSHPVVRKAKVLFDARRGLVNCVNGEMFTNPFALSSVSGLGIGASLATVSSAVNVGCVINTYPYVMFSVFTKPAVGVGINTCGLSLSTSLTPLRAIAQLNAIGTTRRWVLTDLVGNAAVPAAAESVATDTATICFVLVARSATSRTMYANGLQGTTSTVSKTESYDTFNIGGYSGLLGWASASVSNLMLAGVVSDLPMTDAEAVAFSANPWQIFRAVSRHTVLQYESGYASELEDVGTAVTAISTSATTAIPVSVARSAVTARSVSVTTSVPVSVAGSADTSESVSVVTSILTSAYLGAVTYTQVVMSTSVLAYTYENAVTGASYDVVTSIPLLSSSTAVTSTPSALGITVGAVGFAITDAVGGINTGVQLFSSASASTDESAAIISEDVLAVGAEAVTSVYVSIDTGVLLSASNGAVTYTPSALGIVIEAAGKAVTDESAAIISEDVLAVGAEAVTSVFVNIDTMVLLSASNGAVTYTPSALGIVIEAAGKAAPLEHAGFGISVEASGAAVTDESSAIISEDVMTSSNGAVTSSSVAIVTAVPIRAAEDVTATGEAFLTALRPSLIASSAAVTNMLAVMESGVLLISAQFAVPEAINADLRYAAHLVSEHAAVTSSVANLLHAAILRVNGAAEPQYSAERIALPILAVNPIRVVHSKQLTRTISWVEDRFF